MISFIILGFIFFSRLFVIFSFFFLFLFKIDRVMVFIFIFLGFVIMERKKYLKLNF